MTGRTLIEVEVSHDRTARHNADRREVVSRLTGRRVVTVGRHGKFLVFELDDGYTMVAHLGMSGRFAVTDAQEAHAPHTHFVAKLDDLVEIRFVDPRTFGFVAAYDEDEFAESGVSKLGPDAWTDPPATAVLAASLAGRTAPIKALLLDQGPISGLGNIYADEALFLAKVHPLTPGGQIDDEQLSHLLDAVQDVLKSAIESGGTTLEDLAYLLPDGQAGENLSSLYVYGRDGEPCRRCDTIIEKTVVRARSTHFCPDCQASA